MKKVKVKFILAVSFICLGLMSKAIHASARPRLAEGSKAFIQSFLAKERTEGWSEFLENKIQSNLDEVYALERKEQTPALLAKLKDLHEKGRESLKLLVNLDSCIQSQKTAQSSKFKVALVHKANLLCFIAQLKLQVHDNHENLVRIKTRGKVGKPKSLKYLNALIAIKERELGIIKRLYSFVLLCENKSIKEARNKKPFSSQKKESSEEGEAEKSLSFPEKKLKISRFKGKSSAKALKDKFGSFLLYSSEESLFQKEIERREHPFFKKSGVFLWGEKSSQISQMISFYQFIFHKVKEKKTSVVHLLLERVPQGQSLTLDELIFMDLQSLALEKVFEDWKESDQISFEDLVAYLMLVEEKVESREIIRPDGVSLDLIDDESGERANSFCLQLKELFNSLLELKKYLSSSVKKSGARFKFDISGWETEESLRVSASAKASHKAVSSSMFQSLKLLLGKYPNTEFPHDSFILRASAFHVPLYQSLYFLNKLTPLCGDAYDPSFLVQNFNIKEAEKDLVLESSAKILAQAKREGLSCSEFLVLLQKSHVGEQLLSFDPSDFIDEHYCFCIPVEEISSIYHELLLTKKTLDIATKGSN